MSRGRFTDVAAVRRAYDAVAEVYARELFDELDSKPFDRRLLDGFAGAVVRPGKIVDVGCGPGHVAAYIRQRGPTVLGFDLSRAMLAEARTRVPDLVAVAGDMSTMPFADGAFDGLVAFYSVFHFPRERVPDVLTECRRVLAPGAPAIFAVHLGEGEVHAGAFHDVPIELDGTLFDRDEFIDMVIQARFDPQDVTVRPPYPAEHPKHRLYLSAQAGP
ncbi:MAG TPA: class I SAM-dependent methyltransferase [Nitriliruptorales bacterium]